jgi:hypothetical protein
MWSFTTGAHVPCDLWWHWSNIFRETQKFVPLPVVISSPTDPTRTISKNNLADISLSPQCKLRLWPGYYFLTTGNEKQRLPDFYPLVFAKILWWFVHF